MTDAQIIKLYRKREEIKNKMASLNSLATDASEKIVAEMQSRGTRMIENDGQRVTLVCPEPVVYDEEAARTILKRSPKGRAVLKRITIEVIDKKALSSEVQAGNIQAATVNKFASVKPSKPYLSGSRT